MISLYIDTSSNYLYTGIVEDDQLLVETKEELGQQLSVETLPKIVQNFETTGIKPEQIDAIIVVNGPGSFTGIRIGVTIAKTMAWSLHKKIIPISGLQAMALSGHDADYYMPLIDARRGYVFGAIYDKQMNVVVEDTYCPLSELLSKVISKESVKLITNDKIESSLEQESYQPDIVKIVQHFILTPGCNPHLVNPNYLKQTEAEEKQII